MNTYSALLKALVMMAHILHSSTASAESRYPFRSAVVTYSDGSTERAEVSFNRRSISVIYDSEKVDVPYADLTSIELVTVHKGRRISKLNRPGRWKPDSRLRLTNAEGVPFEVTSDTTYAAFCQSMFYMRKTNPITKKSEQSSYNWKDHKKVQSGGGTCEYGSLPSGGKGVTGVRF